MTNTQIVTQYLGMRDLPHYTAIRRSSNSLQDAACALYSCEKEDITELCLDPDFHYYGVVNRVHITFNSGNPEIFYIKNCTLDSGINDVCGMAMANILWKPQYSFVISEEQDRDGNHTLLTKGFLGKRFADLSDDDKQKIDFKSYGAAHQLSSVLGLADRHGENVLYTDLYGAVNIDFGCTFYFPVGTLSNSFAGMYHFNDEELVALGEKEARKLINYNFQENQELLEVILEEAVKQGADFNTFTDTQTKITEISDYLKSLKTEL